MVRVIQISFKFTHAIALVDDPNRPIRCWGDNSDGECNVPEILNSPEIMIAGVKHIIRQVSAGNGHTLALLFPERASSRRGGRGPQGGRVIAWGRNTLYQCTIPEEFQGQIVNIEAGDGYSHFILADETVTSTNQLINMLIRQAIPRETNVTQIVGNDMLLICLHRNNSVTYPARVGINTPQISDGLKISSSFPSSFILRSNHHLVGFGFEPRRGHLAQEQIQTIGESGQPRLLQAQVVENQFDFLTQNTHNTIPPEIQGHVIDISNSPSHAMIIQDDSSVVQWGRILRSTGLEQRKIKGEIPKPERVLNAREIQAGFIGSLVLLQNGKLVYWGLKYSGIQDIPKGLSASPEDYNRRIGMEELVLGPERLRQSLLQTLMPQVPPTSSTPPSRPIPPVPRIPPRTGPPSAYPLDTPIGEDEYTRTQADRIICRLCQDKISNISLPCGHILCKICYNTVLQFKIGDGEGKKECPFCRNLSNKFTYIRLEPPIPEQQERLVALSEPVGLRSRVRGEEAAAAAAAASPAAFEYNEEFLRMLELEEERKAQAQSSKSGKKGKPSAQKPSAQKAGPKKAGPGKAGPGKAGPEDSVPESPEIQGKILINEPVSIPTGTEPTEFLQEIKDKINCPICRIRARNIVLEPCGDTICNVCYDSLTIPKRCPYCTDRITNASHLVFGGMNSSYKNKYLKYKAKYFELKKLLENKL